MRRIVDIVDTTTRDGNQSLWSATGLTTPDILAIAPTMDRVGFHALDFTSSTHMAVSVRFHREDPWERIRLVSAAMPTTPLSFITTGMRFITWVPADEEVMRLAFRLRRAERNPPLPGRRSLQRPDPVRRIALLRTRRASRSRDRAHVLGERGAHARVLRRARGSARRLRRDGPSLPQGPGRIADPGRRARARSALPERGGFTADRAAQPLHHRPRAVRVHGGVARRLRGAAHGGRAARARNVEPGRGDHAPEPRGRGLLPPARPRGARAGLRSFPRARAREGASGGRPQEFDATYYHHQLAGGMVSTTKRMLAEFRRPELFDAVLEEVGRVRAEMGYPIIVTPVSQLVATQAVRNVIDDERWSNVSDETVRYFLGHYGDPAAPPDPEIADRVLSRPRAEELRTVEPLTSTARARASAPESPTRSSAAADDAAEQVEAMLSSPSACPPRAAHARRRRGRSDGRCEPIVTLLSEVGERPEIVHLRVREGRRGGGVAPCDLTTCGASCSTSTARSSTARAPDPRSAGRARGARQDPCLGSAARGLHEREPRAACGLCRRTSRGGARRRRRRVPDPAPERPALPEDAQPRRSGAPVRDRRSARVPARAGITSSTVRTRHVRTRSSSRTPTRSTSATSSAAPRARRRRLLTASYAPAYAGADGPILSRGAMVTAALAKASGARPISSASRHEPPSRRSASGSAWPPRTSWWSATT